MTRIGSLIITLLASLTGGCEKENSSQANRSATVSTTLKADNQAIAKRLAEQKTALDTATQRERALAERKQQIDSLRDIGKRWLDTAGQAGRTGRSDLAGPIAKMERVKSELENLSSDACTAEARGLLFSAMTIAIDAYQQFQQQTGTASEVLVEKVGESSKLVARSEQALNACMSQPIS